MKYVPIPVLLLEVGKPLPVDLYRQDGRLLLRRGLPIESEYHRDKLHNLQASVSPPDAAAWQRAYERKVHTMLMSGSDVGQIANASMPGEIRESDYLVGQQVSGGWLDMQVVLRGILYQGGLSFNPLPRLLGIQERLNELLQEDTDDSLYCLFQALRDSSLGYCPTHGLLCAVICELTGAKLGIAPEQRRSLVAAALTMNIGMGREQDIMSQQAEPLAAWQRELIATHSHRGADMLAAMGVEDEVQLDVVRWHHQWDHRDALPQARASRRLLHYADAFVARVAARRTRSSMAPVTAVKSMVLGAVGDALGVSSAIAQSVGFYPPGSYVQLQGGEIAVSVQRGERANAPWVVIISDKNSMPVNSYLCRNTAEPAYAIRGPENAESVRILVPIEQVRRARTTIPR